MHLFEFAFYGTGLIYALFYQFKLIYIFMSFVIAYCIISSIYPGAENAPNRRKIMFASWTPPSEGIIRAKVEVNVNKALKFLESYPKQQRPSLTHLVIKAAGEAMRIADDLNGKIVFGKFYPFKTVDVSCLVDIDGGKDLAVVLIENCQKKTIQDIRDFINSKAQRIKKSHGDEQHKKRTKVADYLPPFLISVLLKITTFLTSQLGVTIPALAIKKDQFGSVMVSSLGGFGFEDATAPFTPFANCSTLISANAIVQKPIIQNGSIIIGKVMNINVVIDHRYIDGGKAKKLMPAFHRVFEFPEQFSSKGLKKQK